MKTSLEDLITDGQIGAALILAREQFKDNSKFRQEIITLQSKYNTIEKQQRIGTISQDNANLEIAKIRWSLVQISEKKDNGSSNITNFKQYLKYLILPVIIVLSFVLWKNVIKPNPKSTSSTEAVVIKPNPKPTSSTKTDVTKSDSKPTSSTKTDVTKSDSKPTSSTKTDVTKPDPIPTSPTKADVTKPDPIPTSPTKADVTKPDPIPESPTKTDVTKPDPIPGSSTTLVWDLSSKKNVKVYPYSNVVKKNNGGPWDAGIRSKNYIPISKSGEMVFSINATHQIIAVGLSSKNITTDYKDISFGFLIQQRGQGDGVQVNIIEKGELGRSFGAKKGDQLIIRKTKNGTIEYSRNNRHSFPSYSKVISNLYIDIALEKTGAVVEKINLQGNWVK